MTRTAIVYFAHDRASADYASWLSDRLADIGNQAQLMTVAEASAHEVVFFKVLVLISPMRWGRMHGMALAKAVADLRTTGIVVVGEAPEKRVLKLLPDAVHKHVTVFNLPARGGTPDDVRALAEWVQASSRPRQGPPRTLAG